MAEPELAPPLHLEIGVGEQRLAIRLERVEAVILTPPITPVPGTPPGLAGLFNHHGVVYPAVHPMPEAPSEGRHAILVRSERFGRLAVLCDWAHDLVEQSTAEPLDVDSLVAGLVAAYADLTHELPTATHPRAIIRLKQP